MNIYVGNLPYSIGDNELGELFSPFGEISSAKVIVDRDSNRSKGFGFVEMPNNEEGQRAVDELDGKDVDGRNLKINESQPKKPRQDSGYRNNY